MDLNLYAKFPQDIIQAATAYTQHIAGIGNLNTTTAKRVGSLVGDKCMSFGRSCGNKKSISYLSKLGNSFGAEVGTGLRPVQHLYILLHHTGIIGNVETFGRIMGNPIGQFIIALLDFRLHRLVSTYLLGSNHFGNSCPKCRPQVNGHLIL